MFLIGLTGGIATGKSTVSKFFQDLGCTVVDADQLARQVVQPGTSGWRKIRKQFGEQIILPSGELNRELLGYIVFADESKRKLLNSIIHPEIRNAMFWQVIRCFFSGCQYVVLDLPLLFETGTIVPFCKETIVVSCDEKIQLERLMKRNKFSEEEARKRIAVQMALAEKRKLASCIIDNNNSLEDTKQQVKALYSKFSASNAYWKVRLILLSCFVGLFSVLTFVFSRMVKLR